MSLANNLPLLQSCFNCINFLAFDEQQQSKVAPFLFRAYLHCSRIEDDAQKALQSAEA